MTETPETSGDFIIALKIGTSRNTPRTVIFVKCAAAWLNFPLITLSVANNLISSTDTSQGLPQLGGAEGVTVAR